MSVRLVICNWRDVDCAGGWRIATGDAGLAHGGLRFWRHELRMCK